MSHILINDTRPGKESGNSLPGPVRKSVVFCFLSFSHSRESGFYYLKSRYYDPAICRFINADGLASTGQGFLGCNMFAYCNNNPVNFYDDGGKKPKSYDDTVDDEDFDIFPVGFDGNGNGTVPGQDTCIVSGGGHGNPIHAQRIETTMEELACSGEYSAVYGNKALKTVGLVGNQRPDIIAIGIDGYVEIWEFASPSQVLGSREIALLQKLDTIMANNPDTIGYYVPWECYGWN